MAAQKQLLIKADDYGRGANIDPWRRFFDCCLDADFAPSVGVVAETFGRRNKSESLYLRMLVEEYGVEIWNHSLTHADFTQLSSEKIIRELNESQRIIEAETGALAEIFGAPFNRIDERSARDVLQTNLFKGFYCFDGLAPDDLNIEKTSLSSLEMGTRVFGPVRISAFEKDMTRRQWPPFVVLQVHPFYWSGRCLKNFREVLSRLRSRGYQGVSAMERLAYWSAKTRQTPPRPGESLADNLLYEEQAIEAVEQAGREGAGHSGDSAYYFRMLRSGTSEIRMFLRKIGFFGLRRINGQRAILDIGAGIGNWTTAAALIPDSFVTAIDREDRHLRLLMERNTLERISIQITTLEQIQIPRGSYSGLICNNTLSYLDLIDALGKFSESLCVEGLAYVGLQNRLYPLRDALEAAKKGNWAGSRSHLLRLVDNEGAKCGLVKPPFIRYWNSDELAAVALGCGLHLQRRNISPPGTYGALSGHEVFSGHLFAKWSDAAKIRDAIQRGDVANGLFWEIHATCRAGSRPCPESAGGPAILVRELRAVRDGRAGNGSVAEEIADLLASPDPEQALRHRGNFGDLEDCFAFSVRCLAIQKGREGRQQTGFRNSLYPWIADLLHAIVTEDEGLAGEASQGIEQYLARCDEAGLGYWV